MSIHSSPLQEVTNSAHIKHSQDGLTFLSTVHPNASTSTETFPPRTQTPERQHTSTCEGMERIPKKRGRKPAAAKKSQQSSLTNLLPMKTDQEAAKTLPIDLTQENHASDRASAKRSVAQVKTLATDLEVDPNTNRRKRRKTVFPSPANTLLQNDDWEAQLREAAFGAGSMSQPEHLAVSSTLQPQSAALPQSPDSIVIESDGERARHIEGTENVLAVANVALKLTTPSPPKKILKLRKDGKLVAPSAKHVPEQEKPRW